MIFGNKQKEIRVGGAEYVNKGNVYLHRRIFFFLFFFYCLRVHQKWNQPAELQGTCIGIVFRPLIGCIQV